jgi:hypothetical protein
VVSSDPPPLDSSGLLPVSPCLCVLLQAPLLAKCTYGCDCGTLHHLRQRCVARSKSFCATEQHVCSSYTLEQRTKKETVRSRQQPAEHCSVVCCRCHLFPISICLHCLLILGAEMETDPNVLPRECRRLNHSVII